MPELKIKRILLTEEEKKEKVRLYNNRSDVKLKREAINNSKILCTICNHHYGYTHKKEHLKYCDYYKSKNKNNIQV